METMQQAIGKTAAFVLDPLKLLWAKVAAALPNLFSALVLLLAGWLLAKGASWLARRTMRGLGLDRFAERVGLDALFSAMGYKRELSALVGTLVGLFVFVAFLLSALDALQLTTVSASVQALLLYLPNVLGALIVLGVGLLAARWAGNGAQAAAERAGIESAATLGRIVRGIVVFIAALLAIEQLKLDVGFVAALSTALIGALALAVAIAFGLGGRTTAEQLLAGIYARDLVRSGDRIRLADGTEGKVIEVGAVKTRLALDDGRELSLPNRALIEQATTIQRTQ